MTWGGRNSLTLSVSNRETGLAVRGILAVEDDEWVGIILTIEGHGE